MNERPPTETLEAACRAWWDADDGHGKRIANVSWDDFVAWTTSPSAPPEATRWIDDYRRRMAAALVAAVGWP